MSVMLFCWSCKKDGGGNNVVVKKALAFVVQKNNISKLWYIGIDQSSMGTVLEDDLGTVWSNPAWSPDGRNIYYIRNTETPGVNGIYRIKPNGKDFKGIYTDSGALLRHYYQLTSSLDDENVIFSLEIPRTGRKVIELYRMCPCGTQVTRITEFEVPQQGVTVSTESYAGSFDPGDSLLVFSQSDPTKTGVKDVNIYQLHIRNGDLKKLRTIKAKDAAACTPSYSPDGQLLLLSIDGQINTMHADGSNLKPLGTLRGYRPMWDRNGKDFYFSSYGLSDVQPGIYQADIHLTHIELVPRSSALGNFGGFAVNPIAD